MQRYLTRYRTAADPATSKNYSYIVLTGHGRPLKYLSFKNLSVIFVSAVVWLLPVALCSWCKPDALNWLKSMKISYYSFFGYIFIVNIFQAIPHPLTCTLLVYFTRTLSSWLKVTQSCIYTHAPSHITHILLLFILSLSLFYVILRDL